MANSFAVTSLATEPLKLDQSGKAIAVFTVTNTTSKPLRGLAKAKALGNTKQGWLSIVGETERDFPAGGTQQFTVNFNPSEASATSAQLAAGKYEFRLNVASSVNSDEDFIESSPVMIEVPEQKPIPPPPPRKWWLIPVAAVLLICLGLGAWFLLSPKDTRVEAPDATGQFFNDSKTVLEAQGFKVERKDVIAADKKPDLVVNQTPLPKEKVEPGAKITLEVVSASKVPSLKDKTFIQAFDELRRVGLEVGNVSGDKEIFGNFPQRVISQNPQAENQVAKGSKVDMSFPCFPPIKCVKIHINDLDRVRLGAAERIQPVR
jgi:hypothetical protein